MHRNAFFQVHYGVANDETMRTKNILHARLEAIIRARPGERNPVPLTPEREAEPAEPARGPLPKRKKKSAYEIVMQ